MPHIDLSALATVIILPRRSAGGIASTAQRDIALTVAISFVVNVLSPAERNRAVVLTRERTLFFEDIRHLFGQARLGSPPGHPDAGPPKASVVSGRSQCPLRLR